MITREVPFARRDELLSREWLVTNGLGGYASGTLSGACTRRYHGLLIAALPSPLGRTMMLSHVAEQLRLKDGTKVDLSAEEKTGSLEWGATEHQKAFRLETGLPVWTYEFGGVVVEKRLFLIHGQNTVHISYRLLQGDGPVRLKLRAAVHFRGHDEYVSVPLPTKHVITAPLEANNARYELHGPETFPPLRLRLDGQRAAFTLEPQTIEQVLFRVEQARGYADVGQTHSPGHFRVDLTRDQPVTLIASCEDWSEIDALSPSDAARAEAERRRRLLFAAPVCAQEGPAAELVLAADQFIIQPAGRVEHATRARAQGDELRSVIAGYHWFTDWGRDTMISLEGLTLTTGRSTEARWILRTFAQYLRDGLIPNMFPEGENEGLYHTADATLWMFHAVDRYLQVTNDVETLEILLPKLESVVEHHVRGTRFGIRVDDKDGLLRQGEEGYQLTWMDAKCDGWVVTPRRGKAVEINALWYNALRLLEGWVRVARGDGPARPLADMAERVRRSFHERFWYEAGGYLYDVVDSGGPGVGLANHAIDGAGNDAACRPNQIFAVSLPHAVLAQERWQSVVDVVQRALWTPVGLRSLARGHPDYKPTYHGDLKTRDAAYHQGTVWSWLIGPFVDAWMKVHPGDKAGARQLVAGLVEHLDDNCVGTISEVFDAEAPFHGRGCAAQAWGVAELLRILVKTA